MSDAPITRRDLDDAMSGAQQQHDTRYGELQTSIGKLQVETTELRTAIAKLQVETTELRAETTALRAELAQRPTRDELHAMEQRIYIEVGGRLRGMEESIIGRVVALFDEYRDLTPKQAALRTDLDAHVANSDVHVAPHVPAPPRKRRRPR